MISAAARAGDRTIEAIRTTPDAPLADSPAMAPAVAMPQGASRSPAAFDNKKDDSSRLVHVGAMIGVGVPRPVGAEIYLRVTDFFFAGVSYSDFPSFVADPLLSAAGVKNGSTVVTLGQFDAFDADLRLFPFAGSFFLGSSFGRQVLRGAVTEQTALGPQTGTVDLTTIYATPRLGYLWTFGSGITVGMDMGVQLKLSADTHVALPNGATQDMKDNAQKLADLGASYPLPSFHLRLGWQY